MRMYNTNNLIQVEGGEKIKQADKGSWLSFLLTDTNRNLVEGINGKTAKVVLYDKDRNKGWSYSTSVSDNKVRFKLPGNLEIGVYDLDITVNNMVFPSDRNTKIEIVEGATSFSGAGVSETLLELAGYAKTSDLDKKVDKVSGKGLSTNDYTNEDKQKVNSIPDNAVYTDTTYNAGSGLKLDSNIFSVDETVAMKEDIKNPYLVKKFSEVLENILKKEKMEDDLGNWHQVPTGYYFASPNQIENQPSDYGLFRVIKRPGEFSIIWEKMVYGSIYRKSGNRNLMSDWVRIDNPDYKAGSGLTLSSDNVFSINDTIARKSDIPDIDDLGNIDLSGYATKTELNSYLKKSELEPPFTVQRLGSLNQKLFGEDVMPDTLDSWQKLPSGYYKVTPGTLENQPSNYGVMRVINDNGEKTIIYEQMRVGAIYRKSGNSIQMSDWVRIDNPDYKAGAGLKLSGNTFSIDNTIARKSDIPSSIDLSGYAKTNDLDKKVDKVSGKGLSTNDYTSADKKKVSAIPTSPKYTDTTYKAGSGLSLSGTTFSVDSSVAKKSDIDNIKFSRVYTNDDNDRGTAIPGKDYFIRNDGLFGQVTSVDKEKNSLKFSTTFDFSQLNNLYLPRDIDIKEAAYDLGADEETVKKYEPYQEHYYLSRDGYLAKIKHYSTIDQPGYIDCTPISNYIKFAIEESDGWV